MILTYHDISGNLFHHEMESGLIRMGRDPSMDLPLTAPTVSGLHASISRFNNITYLTDLNSTNGTKLNGNLINKSPLSKGDHIQLGEFSLWYEIESTNTHSDKIIGLEIFTKRRKKTILH